MTAHPALAAENNDKETKINLHLPIRFHVFFKASPTTDCEPEPRGTDEIHSFLGSHPFGFSSVLL